MRTASSQVKPRLAALLVGRGSVVIGLCLPDREPDGAGAACAGGTAGSPGTLACGAGAASCAVAGAAPPASVRAGGAPDCLSTAMIPGARQRRVTVSATKCDRACDTEGDTRGAAQVERLAGKRLPAGAGRHGRGGGSGPVRKPGQSRQRRRRRKVFRPAAAPRRTSVPCYNGVLGRCAPDMIQTGN